MALEEVPKDSLTKVSKKQKDLNAGRLKLDEFRKKKAEEKKNKDKSKPTDKSISRTSSKDSVTNGPEHDSIDKGNGTTRSFAILPPDSNGVSHKKDASFQSNGEQRENKPNENLHTFPQTIYASDTVDSVSEGPSNATGSIETLLQPSSNGPQNPSKLIQAASVDDNTHIREVSAWARGSQKAGFAPNMKDLVGSGNIHNDRNEPLFDKVQGNSGISFTKEKETGSVNVPWDRENQHRPSFQFAQKSDGMKTDSLENLPSKSTDLFSYPYRPPPESAMDKHNISLVGPRLSTFSPSSRDLSSSFVSLDKERINHISHSMNNLEKSQVPSRNEDFSALEQHIDELTQEKYLLQRSLEAQRSLSESLSQQNMALTEDYNYQASVINELRDDLEKKKEELAAQSIVLSSLMMEREKAQQENNSALERSQILAGEVISLEEKVLKLRSSELKLQRELESLKSENESCRAHSAVLGKDRQNLKSTLEALQEDKKLLQAHLQQNLVNGGSKNTVVERRETREVATSTDFETNAISEVSSLRSHADVGNIGSSSTSMEIASQYNQLGITTMSTPAAFSPDEHKLINNIDLLIIELVTEKASLLDMLRKQSSEVSELQALNSELSKKLELQTQRLELAVTQNMASEANVDPVNLSEEPEVYFVDEGDEVVDRVLGWIMRLFPGGSSRRRTSKLL